MTTKRLSMFTVAAGGCVLACLLLGCSGGKTKGSFAVSPSATTRATTSTSTTPSTTSTTLTRTELKTFVAWVAGRVNPTLHVQDVVNGTCSEGALQDERQDADRCTTAVNGESTLDPCFQDPETPLDGTPAELVCVRSPYDTAAIVVKASSYPIEHISQLMDPWSVILVTGVRCGWEGGATDEIGGKRLNYGCDDGKTSLYGDPDESQPVWVISAMVAGGTNLSQVPIAAVWDIPNSYGPTD